MQRDAPATLGLDVREQGVDRPEVVHVARERRPQHAGDGDRALIEQGLDLLRADRVAPLLHRRHARLDLEVARELLPARVHVGTHHHVRRRGRLAVPFAPALPGALVREHREHDRLR